MNFFAKCSGAAAGNVAQAPAVPAPGLVDNTEWPLGIATLFTNLREQNLTVRRVLWWSRTARMKPDDSMRTLPISWPDDFDNLGSEEFRKKIGRELKSLKGGWEGAILVEVGMPDPNLSMMETVQLIGGQIRVSEKIRTRAKMQKYESKTQNRIQKLMKKIANKKGTDQLITSIRREEQNDLRKAIFGSRKENPEIECAMCGRSFPNHGDFIVCAHIKRRSDATEEERLNPLIVAPMCKFGCDALFEAGAIIVDSNGVIQINENVARKTSDLFSAADELVGKSCTRYVDGNEDFFAHHRDRFDFH